MEKSTVLRVFIQGKGKKGNPEYIDRIDQDGSYKNKQGGFPKALTKGDHEGHKKYDNAYGITSFDNLGYRPAMYLKYHTRVIRIRPDLGIVSEIGQ